jgi:2-haloacid dehalogenase
MALRPKYVTFDCYGTLIYFEMAPVARRIYADRVDASRLDAFCTDFSAYRLDEVLGAWKPYSEVVRNALERSCKLWQVPFREEDAQAIYAAIPTWDPHPDVPEALAKVATRIPLVILSNSMTDLIPHSVARLGAPFHAAYTAQEAQAYKPRMRAFEYMFDQLGCGPEDVLHCSSSFRYDLMTAHDLRIVNKVFVNRGHEPANPYYGCHEIKDIRGLPGLLGL